MAGTFVGTRDSSRHESVWEHENGPNGGDELSILLPGRNYGWPVVSYGRQYGGARVSEHAWKEGMEEPLVAWLPSIGILG
jgi:glucose/arabinose dehydrogenase